MSLSIEQVQNQRMCEAGAILLVSCYELGHQPLGVAYPAAFLRRAGIPSEQIDISLEPLDKCKVAQALFVGISVPMHTALRLGVQAAERIRAINGDCHICFYGLYASLNADYLLRHIADSCIGGEFEQPLLALVESLAEGHSPNHEGVSLPGKPAKPFLQPLDFPLPEREGLRTLSEYAKLEHNDRLGLVGYVEASRGCKHRCLHCPITPVYEGRFFIVDKSIVLEDVRRLVGKGATHITFGDPDFLNGPGHSLAIARALHDAFPQLTFDFTAKIEHLLKHRELLCELRALGCLFIVSAVESLSDRILGYLEKGHTRRDVLAVLKSVRDAEIVLRPSLVAFTPWTTLKDYLELFEFVESEQLIDHVDPVQYTIRLLVPPGSALLWRSDIQPFLGALDPLAFSYGWTHPDPRMDQLHQNVSTAVENATRINEDSAETFYRIWALTRSVEEGREVVPDRPELALNRNRPPRLTESWFCCAEPTQCQFDVLQ